MEGPGMKCTGNRFRDGDAKLLRDGTFSDCQVVCGDKTWKTHKTILCTRSKWFMTALSGGFKETKDGVVTIQELTPKEVGSVIQYLYTGVVEDRSEFHESQYVWPVQLYRLADFFQIDEMMDSCAYWLRAHCDAVASRIQRNRVTTSRYREIAPIVTLETPPLVEALTMAYDSFRLPQPNRMQDELAIFLNKARWGFLESADFMKQIRSIHGPLGIDILVAGQKVFAKDTTFHEKCRRCFRSIDSEEYEIAFTRLKIVRSEYSGLCNECVAKRRTDDDDDSDDDD